MQYNTARPWSKSLAGTSLSVTLPAAGGFVLPLLLSPSPLTDGTACSGAALSPLNEPKRLRNPQPGQGKAQTDPRAPRCCPWAPACPAPLLSQHPPRFRWALRQVCSCFSNQNHLFPGLFFKGVTRLRLPSIKLTEHIFFFPPGKIRQTLNFC